ncbi:unnamed protein product [Lymnaea stagnalis]|uniref:Uncharacterized protein n=1 Tax=Lymnaea stagnalis TaxID=6523 RepID=A0AAV2ICI0_LYMST
MSQRNLVLFFTAVLLIHIILRVGAALSMDDFVKINCPEKQPFKCAPDANCCFGSEFCYRGDCLTCFPPNVQKDGLLAWCRSIGQYNTSAMKSPMCRLACQDIFNSTELASVDEVSCTKEKPFKCAPAGACCRGSEFCDGGQCQTCFPSNVQKDGLLAWCRSIGQYNMSAMRSPMCRLACQDIFNSTELASVDDNVRPNTAAPGVDISSVETVKALCIAILVFVLIGIVLVLYDVIRKKRSANSGDSQNKDRSGRGDTDQSPPNACSEFECCNVIRNRASQLTALLRRTRRSTEAPTETTPLAPIISPPLEPGPGAGRELSTINGENGALGSPNSLNTPSGVTRPLLENASTAHGGAPAGAKSALELNASLGENFSVAMPPGQNESQSPADSGVPVAKHARNDNSSLITRSVDSLAESPASPSNVDQEEANDEREPLFTPLTENPDFTETVDKKEQKAFKQFKQGYQDNYKKVTAKVSRRYFLVLNRHPLTRENQMRIVVFKKTSFSYVYRSTTGS